jgi:hypothetical protein
MPLSCNFKALFWGTTRPSIDHTVDRPLNSPLMESLFSCFWLSINRATSYTEGAAASNRASLANITHFNTQEE